MRSIVLFIFSNLIFLFSFAQQSFNLSGTINDKRGEALPGAGIYVSGYKIATVADNDGKYILPLKPGNYDILIQLIGYKALNKNVIISDKAIKLDIILEESITNIRRALQVTEQNMIGKNKVFATEIRTLTSDISDIKQDIAEIKEKILELVKELQTTAKRDEVKVLEKYINFWNPVKFVTQNEVESVVKEILKKEIKKNAKK